LRGSGSMEWLYLVLEYCKSAKSETEFYFVAIDSTDPKAKILRIGTERSEGEECWREYYLVPKRTWVLGMRRVDGIAYFENFWIEDHSLITHTLKLLSLSEVERIGGEVGGSPQVS